MKRVRFSEQQRQRMKQMYEKDEASLATIAMNFGCSVPLVAVHLREMGVAIRGKGRRPTKKVVKALDLDPLPKPEPDEEPAEIVEIFDWA